MNMEFKRRLPEPREVMDMYPVSEEMRAQKEKNDREIRRVFTGESDKLILLTERTRCLIISAVCAVCRKR